MIINRYLAYFCCLFLFLSACTVFEPLTLIDKSGFTTSSYPIDSLLIPFAKSPGSALKGKAKVILSQPGSSDRFTTLFEADSVTSKLRIRNSLSIEAIRLFIKNDSITVHNRIDKTLETFQRYDPELLQTTGIVPFNIYTILYPFTHYQSIQWQLEESDDYFRLTDENGDRFYISKVERQLQSLEQHGLYGNVLSLNFADFITFKSTRIPRTIVLTESMRTYRMTITIGNLGIIEGTITPFNWPDHLK